jgi:AcrR family transcriptional regulator
MTEVKSRREMYSAATRAALLEEATALFAERGYSGTSLEDVASASQVTRGAVYHHFASKQALFEAVLELQEARVTAEVLAAAQSPDPWEAAMRALGAYLDHCCDPAYGRLVERFIRDLIDGGYLDGKAFDSLVQFSFWMLGGAGLAVAEAPPPDKPRVRDEWGHLIGQAIGSLRIQ